MANKNKAKNNLRKKKAVRIKNKLKLGEYPRLVVFRSNRNIYAQIIDDNLGKTLVAASSVDRNLIDAINKTKTKLEKSKIVGKAIGERGMKSKISQIIFDRNGYKYHGRIKTLADSARAAGLKF